MKILIFAYACDPNRQSELGLGWNISREIARRHEVTLVTREKNRAIFEKYLAEHPDCPHVRTKFLYHDTNGFLRKFKDWIPFGTQLYFSNWLKTAAQKYENEMAGCDVVHQLTFCPFFIRPWGAEKSDKFVWGPVGGGGGPYVRFGKEFLKREPLKVRLRELVYQVLWWWIEKSPFGAGFRATRRKAKAVAFKATAFSNGYEKAPGQVVSIARETGYAGEFRSRTYLTEVHPLKIITVGRMIASKAFGYAIRSFAEYLKRGGDGTFTILGDGELRKDLDRLAVECGVDGKVIFAGNVPNAKVHEMLDSSDIFFFPSFSEATSWALLEAMIHGLPIVCHNRSGMADIVTPECGTAVTTESPDAIVGMYAEALLDYYGHPEKIAAHGKGAVERIKNHYSWDAVGRQFDSIYSQIAEKR